MTDENRKYEFNTVRATSEEKSEVTFTDNSRKRSASALPKRKWRFKGKLTIVDGPGEGKTVFINKTHFTIGRSDGCSLVIDSQKSSRIHAQIIHVGEMVILEDMGSTNGTFVNEEQITRMRLEPGDEIEIGDVLIVFEK